MCFFRNDLRGGSIVRWPHCLPIREGLNNGANEQSQGFFGVIVHFLCFVGYYKVSQSFFSETLPDAELLIIHELLLSVSELLLNCLVVLTHTAVSFLLSSPPPISHICIPFSLPRYIFMYYLQSLCLCFLLLIALCPTLRKECEIKVIEGRLALWNISISFRFIILISFHVFSCRLCETVMQRHSDSC